MALSLYQTRHRGSHEIIVARTATDPARDLLVKAPRRSRLRAEALRKRAEIEHHVLTAFIASYELSVPWRRLAAQRRMDVEAQAALFWRAYSGTTGPATKPELIVRRFTRVLGMARFITLCLYGRSGEDLLAAAGSFADATAPPLPAAPSRRSLKSCLLEPWWRYRLRAASRQELDALRDA